MKDAILGFIFLGSVSMLAVATVTVGKFTIFKDGISIAVEFKDARGLENGDPVYVDGVEVGQVSEIQLDAAGVLVVLSVDKPFTLYEDYQVLIEESSLVGGKLISIKRGTNTKLVIGLSPATRLKGKDDVPFLTKASDILEENREDIRSTIKNLKNISETFNESLRSDKGTIPKLMKDDTVYKNLDQTLGNLADITQSIKSGGGTFGKLFTDDGLYNQAKSVVDDVRKFIEDLKTGKGAIPRLISDEKMADDLSETMSNLKVSTNIIREMLEEAKEKDLIGKLSTTLEGADNTIGRAGRADLYLKLGYTSFVETEASVLRLGFDFWPSDDKFFYFGLSQLSLEEESSILFKDQVEENDSQSFLKPEVQLGYVIPWFLDKSLTIRAGLIEGKPGGGLDINIDRLIGTKHPVKLSFEIRQAYSDLDDEDIDELIDGSMMRIYLKTPLRESGEEWWEKILASINLFAGYSRISNDPEFMFGISLEYLEKDLRSLVGLLGSGF